MKKFDSKKSAKSGILKRLKGYNYLEAASKSRGSTFSDLSLKVGASADRVERALRTFEAVSALEKTRKNEKNCKN